MKELTSIQINVSGIDYNVRSDDVTPQTSLNCYLREKLHLTGTKRMCMEGGCGACIVAVEEVKPTGEKSIFACLVSILSCHGWKIHSIEGIGNPLIGFHEIQQLLVDNNGTQCGFCSPGMVMNMYALQQSGPKTKSEIENSFGGNICRCTGYRPILQAFSNLASDKNQTQTDIEDISSWLANCPRNNHLPQKTMESFFVKSQKSKWVKVYYMTDLLEILRTSEEIKYMLVAGNTSQGVIWPTSYPELYIDITSIKELTTYTIAEDTLILGANITLTKAIELFYDTAKKMPKFSYLTQVANHIDLVANVPVRNVGTIAGNLMIKHEHQRFQSDIFLLMETIGATIIIVDEEDNEIRKSPQDFLDINMDQKVIKQIILKGFDPKKYFFGSYKIMKRAQNTHAIVNAGFLLELSSKNANVKSAAIVYGAITKRFVHAAKTEFLLKGHPLFDNTTLQKTFKSLSDEINPDIDPPDPAPECRKQLALNLFYKFVLSIAPQGKLTPRNQTGGSMLTRALSSGIQEFSTNKEDYPLTQPVVKLEALAQTSGQAQYIMDKPDLPHQLHGCFVTAEAPAGSTIKSINYLNALKLNGVVAFYGAKDIPGINSLTALSFQMPPEELFCSKTVRHYSQFVGVVIATSHDAAYQGSKLVEITYDKPEKMPLLTPKELVLANRKDKIQHFQHVMHKKQGKATKTITGELSLGSQYHYHMETQTCYAIPTEDGLEIWSGTQWVALTQFVVSQVIKMDAQKIDVTVKRLGGSFGGKIIRATAIAAAAALAATKLQKPVRIWMPFHTNMKAAGRRNSIYTKYEIGVDAKGIIQNMTTDIYSDMGSGVGVETVAPFLLETFESGYNSDTWDFDVYTTTTDCQPSTYTRSPGTLEAIASIEIMMENIAYALNLNPVDVRLANIDNAKNGKITKYVNEIRTKDKLDQRMAEIKEYNKNNRWKKKGIALTTMKYPLSILGNYAALVSVFYENGGVAISHAGVEMGQGINTKVAQVCAYKFGIPLHFVSIKPTVSYVVPNSFATGGSWTSEVICYSVILACEELLARMEPVKKVNPTAPWDMLVKMCHAANINLSAGGYAYMDKKNVKDYDIYGVCAAEVEVDILTGQNVINRVDLIEDVGTTISPLIDIGQVEGAFVMGLGYFTSEEMHLSPDGELLNNRTWNYTPPGAKDIPVDFRVRFPANNPNPDNVLNMKATAEPPLCLSVVVPLAIRNALASAREDADKTQSKWIPFDGPTTVEFTIANSLTDYSQFSM